MFNCHANFTHVQVVGIRCLEQDLHYTLNMWLVPFWAPGYPSDNYSWPSLDSCTSCDAGWRSIHVSLHFHFHFTLLLPYRIQYVSARHALQPEADIFSVGWTWGSPEEEARGCPTQHGATEVCTHSCNYCNIDVCITRAMHNDWML